MSAGKDNIQWQHGAHTATQAQHAAALAARDAVIAMANAAVFQQVQQLQVQR